MTAQQPVGGRLEQGAWISFLACVALVPLAVAKYPFLSVPFTFSVFGFPQSAALAVGLALTLALWGAAVILRQAVTRWSWPLIGMAAFAAWAGVATVLGFEPARSFFGTSMSSFSFVEIVAYAAAFYLAVQLINSHRRIKALTWCIIASSTVVAGLALPQQYLKADIFGLPLTEPWMIERGFSTIGNPDHLGTFLVLPTILSMFLLLFAEAKRERVVAGCCLAVLLAVLTGTLTRGAWIGTFVGTVLALGLLWRAQPRPDAMKRTVIVVAICIGVITLGLTAADNYQLALRFRLWPGTAAPTTVAQTVNSYSSDRLNLWETSLHLVARRPLAGTGPAAYQLGWYGNAIDPSSAGGAGGLADDPHSFPFYILSTTGIPGLLLYLLIALAAMGIGAKNTAAMTKGRTPSGTSMYYVAWFTAAVALQLALLVAAIDVPILLCEFLVLGVLLRPQSAAVDPESRFGAGRFTPGLASIAVAVLLAGTIYPQLAAEVAMARAVSAQDLGQARQAARSVPWNQDMQQAYFSQAAAGVDASLASGSADTTTTADQLLSELVDAGTAQPHELYYPALRARLLTTMASQGLGDRAYAERALQAADDALAIMPASIPVRVNKALALDTLKRYAEMAEVLEGYWRNELSSAYPGILYAQGLALSGSSAQAELVFDELATRFPSDASIDNARQQIRQMEQPK